RHAGRGRGRAGPGRRVASRAADPGRALHVSAAAPHQLLAPRQIHLPRHARTGSGGLAVTPVRNILRDRLSDRSARVGVIGLGYVGLPLAVEFARAGFVTTGIDLDARKVDAVNRGTSYIPDVPTPEVARLVGEKRLRATADFAAVAELDTINICVPTPLRKTKDPDMSYIVSAVEQIAKYLHPGMLVILESTTYPGTTDEVVKPMLEATGLVAAVVFYLAFSPERVDPGNPTFNTRNVPKVVGGF